MRWIHNIKDSTLEVPFWFEIDMKFFHDWFQWSSGVVSVSHKLILWIWDKIMVEDFLKMWNKFAPDFH
jgi:hypothetical protein